MKTKTDNIKNLEDVHARKIELQAKIEAQRREILDLAKDLQENLNPQNILNSVTKGFISSNAISAIPAMVSPNMLQNVGAISQYFIKDRRKVALLRIALPIALIAAPKIIGFVKTHLPEKEDISHFFNTVVNRIKSVVG